MDTFANSDTCTFIGSAAVLVGVTHMTISRIVILLEATCRTQTNLNHAPFFEPEMPDCAERHKVVAGQDMLTDTKGLHLVDNGILYNTVRRSALCTLLMCLTFGRRARTRPMWCGMLPMWLTDGPRPCSDLIGCVYMARLYSPV